MENLKKYCGVDVGSETLSLCLQETEGKFHFLEIKNSKSGFEKLEKEHGLAFHFVMEATGVYHLNFVFYLMEKKALVSVVNALQIKRFIQMHLERNKSDVKDAKYLCLFGISQQPPIYQLPDDEYFICKSLNSSIETLTNEITLFKNQLHALKRVPVQLLSVAECYETIIQKLSQERQKLEQELNEQLEKWQPELLKQVSSVVGIGKRATAELIVFTQGFNGMENYRQLISYAGLSPTEYSSGSTIRGRSKICKQGGSRLRHILYMCAMNAIKTNKQCKALFERLVAKGKNKKVALIAVCNKLLKQVFGVVKNKAIFDNNYQFS